MVVVEYTGEFRAWLGARKLEGLKSNPLATKQALRVNRCGRGKSRGEILMM